MCCFVPPPCCYNVYRAPIFGCGMPMFGPMFPPMFGCGCNFEGSFGWGLGLGIGAGLGTLINRIC